MIRGGKLRQSANGHPHVAFIVETSLALGRNMLQGFTQYVRENGPWAVYVEQRSIHDPAPAWLWKWKGDGIVFRLSPYQARLMRKSHIPMVNVDDQMPLEGVHNIQSDQEEIGRLGAEHLLERGFTQFAFFGYPRFRWSRRRFDGFAERVRAAGFSCVAYQGAQVVSWGHQQTSWEMEVDALAKWVAQLPKPLGLMAGNDYRGAQAIDACRRAGIAVPEQVAVIACGNDHFICDLADPALSSVIPNGQRIGYEAAALLDRMMRGERPEGASRTIPPVGIFARQSTDVMAISEPRVVEAMRFIREHAALGIGVDDVVEHVMVSRSVLKRLFRTVARRTIHEVIAAERLRRAKRLLVETELSIAAIAERTGYGNTEYLSTTFRKATGLTPSRYRRENQKIRPGWFLEDSAKNGPQPDIWNGGAVSP